MRKLLPLALTIGLSAAAFAQDSNTCMCSNNGDVRTRMVDGKLIQEDKHTINVITPAPGQRTVTTYTSVYDTPRTSMYVANYNDMSNNGDVKVRVDRNGTVIQTDKNTINKVSPAPSNYAMLSSGYVMSPSYDNDVRVTVDKNGTVVQTDKTTINKITPAPASMTTTVVTRTTSDDHRDFQD